MRNLSCIVLVFTAFFIFKPGCVDGQHRMRGSVKIAADWHHRYFESDSVYGVGTYKTEELLFGMTPVKVIVAVLDSGTDTDHPDLKANLWINKGEIPLNGKDDDGNGFVDDYYGWNFLGSAKGDVLLGGELEADRLFFAMRGSVSKGDKDYDLYINRVLPESKFGQAWKAYEFSKEAMADAALFERWISKNKRGGDAKEISYGDFKMLLSKLDQDKELKGKRLTAGSVNFVFTADTNMTWTDLKAALAKSVDDKKFLCDSILASGAKERELVGDGYVVGRGAEANLKMVYGNSVVNTAAAYHGTHVAGIIGAARDNGIGIDGVANCVKIMTVRVVPNGDEYDKDIAMGIRYAVDNGAKIINASFGKNFSPDKSLVDDAIRYAESKGVLFVHAAGNEGRSTDGSANYPVKSYLDGGEANNFINVGASTMKGSAAPFSNYGVESVDLFAPGFFIYSTQDGGLYKQENGTSMAAPVVSGAAAVLMGYFPELTMAQVKEILLKSVTHVDALKDRCSTGGILNLYEAVKLAKSYLKDSSLSPLPVSLRSLK